MRHRSASPARSAGSSHRIPSSTSSCDLIRRAARLLIPGGGRPSGIPNSANCHQRTRFCALDRPPPADSMLALRQSLVTSRSSSGDEVREPVERDAGAVSGAVVGVGLAVRPGALEDRCLESVDQGVAAVDADLLAELAGGVLEELPDEGEPVGEAEEGAGAEDVAEHVERELALGVAELLASAACLARAGGRGRGGWRRAPAPRVWVVAGRAWVAARAAVAILLPRGPGGLPAAAALNAETRRFQRVSEVERTGIEPVASSLQSWRSPS